MDLVTLGIVLAFGLLMFLMSELSQRENGGIIFMPVLLLVFIIFGVSFKTGTVHADHRMYEQIRDDVNITEHKLYKKWLIDNPKK